MADINIERKNSSVWPWVIGILVLAIVVVVLMQYMRGRNDNTVNAPGDSATVQQAPTYQPAPPPASTDTITGDSAKLDTVKGTTTSSQ
jgi:hypothetical protein